MNGNGFEKSHGTIPSRSISDIVLDSLAEMVLSLDESGTIVNANRATSSILGYPFKDILGKELGQFIHPDDMGNIKMHMREVKKGGAAHYLEVTAIKASSERLTLTVLVMPKEAADDGAIFWLTGKDITKTRTLGKELQALRRYTENLMSSADEGFVTLSKEGAVLKWSKGAEAIFKIPSSNMIGKPFHNLFWDSVQRKKFMDRLREVVAGKSFYRMEYENIRGLDKRTLLRITCSPILEPRGVVNKIIVVIKDQTEKRHLEERLKESEKRLATEVIKKIEDLKYIEQMNRLVVQYMEEGAILFNTKFEIGFVNPKIIDLIGFDETEIINHTIGRIVPEDLLWVWSEIPVRTKNESFRFESALLSKDGEEVPVMVTASRIRIESKKSEFLCTIMDLIDQKAKEEEMRGEMMELKVKRGSVLLMVERGYMKLENVMLTLNRLGHKIMVLTRRSVKDRIEPISRASGASLFWLEERRKGNRSIRPTRKEIRAFLSEKIDRTTVVIFDRLDYIISKIDINGFLDLLHDLVEIIYHRKAILILIADPISIDELTISRINTDAPILETNGAVVLPDELQDVLEYINAKNRKGVEPSYKLIGKHFEISKTTTRKRIQQLLILELLIESKTGRRKILKLTERGRRFVRTKPSRYR